MSSSPDVSKCVKQVFLLDGQCSILPVPVLDIIIWRRHFTWSSFTINIPLILREWKIVCFSRAKHIIGHFEGFFEGPFWPLNCPERKSGAFGKSAWICLVQYVGQQDIKYSFMQTASKNFHPVTWVLRPDFLDKSFLCIGLNLAFCHSDKFMNLTMRKKTTYLSMVTDC